jgi:DNA-binding LytR/AlgR family response regulator
MIKAIAIDDEPLALNIIENFCQRSEKISLEKTFTSPQEGLKYLNKYPVNLVFLDIQMPSLTGVELVKNLKQDVMVIFTTAFDNYAVEGFNLNALDYLLKPFSFDRFAQAVDKVTHYQGQLLNPANSDQSIFVRADYSLVKIEFDKIKYIEGLDDYIKIHLEDSKPVVARYTMKFFLENLPSHLFIRVHRSYIVPLKKISAYKNKSLKVLDSDIPVGPSYEATVMEIFNNK